MIINGETEKWIILNKKGKRLTKKEIKFYTKQIMLKLKKEGYNFGLKQKNNHRSKKELNNYAHPTLKQEIKNQSNYIIHSSAKTIIARYWTHRHSLLLKKLCITNGLFAYFFFNFESLLEKKKLIKLYNELEKKRQEINLKRNFDQYFGGGVINDFVSYKTFSFTQNIPPINTHCIFCNKRISSKKFDFISFYYIKSILEAKSIKDICICQACYNAYLSTLLKQTNDKQEALKIIKDMYNILGFIPPHKYYPIHLIKNIPKNKLKRFLYIIKKMPFLDFYKANFGSWFNVLVESGVLKEGTRKLSRGTMCKAKDNHTCLSMSEQIIDDWFTKHNIKHLKEPFYPKDKEYNPYGRLRADWKVGRYYIEFFGLKGNKDYDIKIELKRDLCQKKRIHLIEIYSSDLKRISSLTTKLKVVTSL